MSVTRTFFVLALSMGYGASVAAKRVNWRGPETCYVGFPGVTAERYAFLSKYCTEFWCPETGEWVSTQSADMINYEATQVIEFPEIVRSSQCSRFQRYRNSWWRSGVWMRQTGTCIKKFSSCPYSIMSYGVDRSQVSMGQEHDVAAIRRQLVPALLPYRIHESVPVKSVWLAYSRGVSAALRYIDTASPEELLYLPDALILEGGLDVIQHFLQHIFDPYLPSWVSKHEKPRWLMATMLQMFKYYYAPRYRSEWDDAMNAIADAVARKIPADIPILLIASRNDELVSYRLMVRLYRVLRQERKREGYDNVHLLLLDKARHSYYVDGINNREDRDNYEGCVHAFYRRYGLAYDEALADRGERIFQETTRVEQKVLLNGTLCSLCRKDASTLSFCLGRADKPYSTLARKG